MSNSSGEEAINLDKEIANNQKLHFRGNNYPNFDISSTSEIASVKTHLASGGEFTDSIAQLYVDDFWKMLGDGRAFDKGKSPTRQDAINILSMRDAGILIPKELLHASAEEAENFIQEKSVMRIIDDHLPKVKEVFMNDTRTCSLPEDMRHKYARRFKGIGLNENEIRRITGE